MNQNAVLKDKSNIREYRWWEDTTKFERLRYAWSVGSTDEEACSYAEISLRQLQYYQENNLEFVEQKELLKLNPLLKARQTLFEHLNEPKVAMWFLERKLSEEFGRVTKPIVEEPKHPYAKTIELAKTDKKVANTLFNTIFCVVEDLPDSEFSAKLDEYVREVYEIEPVRKSSI